MKQRGKLVLLVVLMGVLVLLISRLSSSPEAAGAQPSPVSTPVGAAPGKRLVIPDAHLQVERLNQIQPVTPAAFKRNIFEYYVVAPPPEPVDPVETEPVEPPPPPPPPAPVRFYGFSESQGGTSRRVFLTDGEEIYVVGEGENFLRRYRVARITLQSVEVEDTASPNRWVIPLEQP